MSYFKFKKIPFKLHVIMLSGLFSIALVNHAQTMVPADNATNVAADMQFKLTFSSSPTLQRSGRIRLYQSNGSLVETIDLATMPSGVPMSANWPWIESLNSTAIRVIPVTVDGNSVYIRFSVDAMNYSTDYYITIDQSVFSNVGFSGITANNWRFTTRSQPASDLNYTVSADGTGDFATLQGALNFLPSGTSSAKIFIKNGTYVGLAFMKNKNGYTIEGESKEGVFIKGFNNSNLNASTHWRSVVNLQGNDIKIISLTFINTTPNGGTQAEVLKVQGDRVVIANCEFYSYQDTVLIEGKVYFIDCMLEGDVDFIWGVGTVFFQSCELRANDNGGYNVMARNDNTKHGYAFADCKITRKSNSTSTQYLGRDANTSYPYAEIVYLNCFMDSHVPAVGWQIRNEMDANQLFFAEYRSTNMSGNLLNTSSRHAKSRQLSQSQATQYRDLNWFFNGWVPVVPDYKQVYDCNGDENGTAVWDECGICTGGKTGKEACTQDCTGEWGGKVLTDACGTCMTNDSILPCTGSLEAETACDYDGTIDNNNEGFSGIGFLNTTNTESSFASWVLNSADDQSATISFRYANGGNTSRDGTLTINGVNVGTVSLSPTGAWTTWAMSSVNLYLIQGSNNLVLTPIISDGLANIDLLSFSEGVSDAGCIVTGQKALTDIELTYYPNPTQNNVYWNNNLNWKLFDVHGLELQSGNGNQADLSNFPAGVYIIQLGEAMHQLIKE